VRGSVGCNCRHETPKLASYDAGPRRLPPLRGIALPEKRIHIFVLAAQRIGYLTSAARDNGRRAITQRTEDPHQC
jgi:hypothetical protein